MEEQSVEQVIRDSFSGLDLPERCYSYMAGIVIDDPPNTIEELQGALTDFLTDGEKLIDLATPVARLWSSLLQLGMQPQPKLERITAQQICSSLVLSEIGVNREIITADYVDPFLGIQRANINFNTSEKLRKYKEKYKKPLKEENKALPVVNKTIPKPQVVHHKGEGKNMDILLDRFSLMIGGKVLLENSSLKLASGRKYGLIGRNGIGKTCLLTSIVLREIGPLPSHMNIAYVEQEVTVEDAIVFDHIVAADSERLALLNTHTEDAEESVEIQKELLSIDAFTAESRAATILSGLGFSQQMMQGPITALSGGWRMRVALARALFCQPDLLLLDEPTNHLDLETVIWLERYISNYPKTVVLVSHDRDFLNNVTTNTIHFKDQRLIYYRGNYDVFERTMTEHLIQQKKRFESQKSKTDHMQKFIDKFRCNAKRASLVQSRIKALKRMDIVDDVIDDPMCIFIFPQTDKLSPPLLRIDDGKFGYSSESIIENININIDMSTRMALLGRNGCGKTTLLKILNEELDVNEGHVYRHRRLRVATFTQHHIDQLELSYSALEQLASVYPEETHESLRAHLGSFGISGNLALRPLCFLSGGQKSRVAFALVAFRKPHVLLLDEPTNHLDIDAVDALIIALSAFSGGVIVVSHDQFFVSSVCDELWVIKKKRVRKFKGEFSDYRKQLLD